ncbi:hypothetical protein EW145_g1176 [Phellinidium pouzarii]|uniref:Uncharacterized protein n=1 Tax=Phellinidium pouzarii TaxID=167371 RepID=A0A4S4LHA3_9AGAM|nr:hypothetical protein EW145_g1176 [Phellinidium pouzarii]
MSVSTKLSVPISSTMDVSNDEDDLNTIRNITRRGSDASDVEDTQETDMEWPDQSNYSSRMDEILSENDGSDNQNIQEEDDEDGFLYTGKDADEATGGYREQLKDVLDDELDNDEDTHGVNFDSQEESSSVNGSHIHVAERMSEYSASTSSFTRPSSFPIMMSTALSEGLLTRDARDARPFLHPSISRLRSSLQVQDQRVASPSSLGIGHSIARGFDTHTSSPSHISSISRTSSVSNLQVAFTSASGDDNEQEAFKWTSLRLIGQFIFQTTSEKANAVLGSPALGAPTVIAANGLICIGTDAGRVLVFDFKQHFKCICGDETSARPFGPVTALALSHDHTYVAVGHAHGHIQLFDTQHPNVAARTVNPTNLAAVTSGRQEGHLLGSRIVALDFISGRHTAFVSADDQGLAFFHSLGKVLFMEANDCLRILGKYPDEEPSLPVAPSKRSEPVRSTTSTNSTATPRAARRQAPRKGGSILAMGHLPLGTVAHPTDTYQLVALLTPIKLVIVGLKPTPKTWFRRHRDGEDGTNGKSRWRGCLAWFPSISIADVTIGDRPDEIKKGKKIRQQDTSYPLLAFSWGCKTEKVENGKIVFSDHGSFTLRSDILAIQWLNVNQLILFTDTTLEVLDIRTLKIIENIFYDALNLISPTLSYSSSGALVYQESVRDIQHSLRTYKGKIFVLEYRELKVGTLLSWADRILSLVQEGNFLSAINLARDYYLDQAKGNKNGLPEDLNLMRVVVGEKMKELMVASARYTFSEDRLTDSTHVTPGHRGVDRTSLFEDLVSTCARACIVLDEFDILFEELYQCYEDSGILRIYLRQLEPFVLDSSIHYIPPRITQRLIGMHDEDGKHEAAETIIWHIDPDCLDINQALTLCQKYCLYDALVYIYNTALRDYITPVVELIGLVRKVQQIRRERLLRSDSLEMYNSAKEEQMVLDAYKIYPYISSMLSGLSYPSEKPLPLDDALTAQNDVYSFLFYGRSSVWPDGDGGRLVLTADEEGGVEPTYPYARLLLRFDAEAFLHILDIAFEQSYLNDESQGTSRQIIVKILLDIVATSRSNLTSADVTFVNIFISRNVPKYPQFIHIAPSSMQNLLIELALDKDQSTKEDRQLAAEFLLSAYTPHNSEQILSLFEDAQFYRILRSWYRQERHWVPLLRTYLRDPDLSSPSLFPSVEGTLVQASRANGNTLPGEVLSSIVDSLPLLLQNSIPQTALLIDKYAPGIHAKVLDGFDDDAYHKRYAYLRCLLGPPASDEDSLGYLKRSSPSMSVDPRLRKLYLKLLCRLEPANTISGISYLPRDSLEVNEIATICEDAEVYEAVVWLLNEESAIAALSKLETFNHKLVAELGEVLIRSGEMPMASEGLNSLLSKLDALCRIGIKICRGHSDETAEADVPLEDLWFKLLSSQIEAVQVISSSISAPYTVADAPFISSLHSLVHDCFTGLVAVSSTKAVSFPRLFKRLVDAAMHSRRRDGTPYSEFRNILTGMLESYRSEGELLLMSKRIVDGDFFDTLEELTKERSRGWTAQTTKCPKCRRLIGADSTATDEPSRTSLIISPSGIYHSACFSSPHDV